MKIKVNKQFRVTHNHVARFGTIVYIPVHCNYLLTKRKLKIMKNLFHKLHIQNVACTKMYMYY